MLKQRLLTAAVLIALFLGILFIAPASTFNLFVGVVLTLAGWEWGRLSGLRSRLGQLVYPQLIVVLTVLIIALIGQGMLSWWIPFAIATGWWCLALVLVMTYPASAKAWGGQWTRLVMGLLVLVPTALALYFFRSQPNGHWWVLVAVAVVVLADSGAYFVGRAFGRRKLAPAVSPGKSWEGVLGGILTVAIFAGALSFFNPAMNITQALLTLLPAAFCSVLGDLLESMLKRHRGVKDSSQLLPGHGGVMDRIDALSAAAPVLALSVIATGWTL